MNAGGLLRPRALRRAARGELSGSLWRQAGRRLRRNRAAMGSIGVLLAIALASIFIPAFWPHAVEDASWENILLAPSFENWHWFGTDANGRDQFVRVFYGGRISLTIGLMTTLVALGIGVGYGAVEWLTLSRIVRGQTLSVKAKEYVESAVAIGLPKPAILGRYIIPNVAGPVVVYVTLLIPTNILIESYLSFIGLGVQEPLTSWGLLISQAVGQLDTAPWLILFPATLLAITMFCFNFIGDGLRDALDPASR